MDKAEMSRVLLEAKKQKGLTWQDLSNAVGMHEVWLASVCYGENSANEEAARKLAKVLDVGEPVMRAMLEFPVKGNSLGERSGVRGSLFHGIEVFARGIETPERLGDRLAHPR